MKRAPGQPSLPFSDAPGAPDAPDADARRAAACALDRNVVVIAGAGTGKTSLLVERALVSIGSGRLRMGRLVALTFTDRAAAQLRGRLAEGLEDLLNLSAQTGPADPREEAIRALDHLVSGRAGEALAESAVADFCRQALSEVENAFAGTIHGFAAELLRRHPREAGVDPYFVVDEGPAMRRLHDASWPGFLAAELGEGSAREPLWREMLAAARLSELEMLAVALQSPMLPLGEPGTSGWSEAETSFRQEAAKAATGLRPLLDEPLNDKPRGWIREAVAALDGLVSEGFGAAWIATRRAEPWEKDPDLGQWGRNGFAKEARERMRRARVLLDAAGRVREAPARLALQLIEPYVASLRAVAARTAVTSFDALLVAARDLLRNPEILDTERMRVDLLLVDEFQDTDPIQYEIVLALAGRSGSRDADPFRLPLAPGRLFFVGDPKQSIYRFRRADIASCERAAERIVEQGGLRVVLRANFRSPDAILEPLNRLFAPAFSAERPPVQPAYEPIVAGASVEPAAPAVEVLSLEPVAGERIAAARLREGRAVASAMRQLASGGVPWSQMALLLPVMAGVGPVYARALREANIPFVMEGGRAFGDKTEVHLMKALAMAVARRFDAVAFLAVARSPLGGATDVELARWAQDHRFPPTSAPDEREFPGIARTDTLIRSCRRRIAGLPVEEALRVLLEETPVLPLVAIGWEGPQRVVNLRDLVESAAGLARQHGLSLEAAIDSLTREIESEDPGEAALSDEGHDAVKLLTVHRAKGLEFPHVFVADLRREKRPPRGRRDRKEVRRVAEFGLGFTLRTEDGETVTPAEAVRRVQEPRFEDAELIRCFYVACTRAMARLTLVNSGPREKGIWTPLLAAWGYVGADETPDGPLAERRVVHRIVRDSDPAHERLARADVRGGERRAVEAFDAAFDAARRADRPWRVVPSGLAHLNEAAEALAEGESAAEGPRRAPGSAAGPRRMGNPLSPGTAILIAAGSVLHTLLERWDGRDPDWFRRMGPSEASREGARRGVPAEEVLAEVGAILDGFLSSPLPARRAGVHEIGREVPMLHPIAGPDGPVLLSGIADLLYRDADGTFVVADYKTDRPGPGGAESLIARYGPQLNAYLRGLRAVLPSASVRAELWLLRLGEVVEVPVMAGDSFLFPI